MVIKQETGRNIAWFDVHSPHQNPLDGPLGFAHDMGVSDFIIGGDFLDCSWSSHWKESIFPELGFGKLREMFYKEMAAGENIISEIRKAIGKKARLWYIPGNHEAWLWYSVFKHRFISPPMAVDINRVHFKSDIEALIDLGLAQLLAEHLHADRYNMTVLAYNEPLKIGKVVYLHGHQFSGQNPTTSSIKRWPSINLVMGHHHTEMVQTTFNEGNERDVHQHVICPALCGLAPGFLKDKSNRWMNGFWMARVKDGLFSGNVIKVFDGKIAGE